MKRKILVLTLALMSWIGISAQSHADYDRNWPAWRGPDATGVAPAGNPPVTWSESNNIRWKAEIPGLGHSTPVIWQNRVFVTTAVPQQEHPETPTGSW